MGAPTSWIAGADAARLSFHDKFKELHKGPLAQAGSMTGRAGVVHCQVSGAF